MAGNSDRDRAARYFRTALAVCGLVMAVIVAVNLLVDPFGMFHLVEVAWLNGKRPAIYHRVRVMKAYDLRRIRPQAVVLGTSRSHLGLRMSHPGWQVPRSRRYNLAFDGATTREMYAYLRHAHAITPLRQVVLGLDAYHPLPVPASTRPDFDEDVLLKDDSLGSRLAVRLEDLKLLSGATTLLESWHTVAAQTDSLPSWFAPDGQRLGDAFFHRPGEAYMQDGPRHYFDDIDRLEVGFQLQWRVPRPARATGFIPPATPDNSATSLDYIGRIVAFCRDESIDLRIFITPSHVHQLEIAAATGGWTVLEDGKRALVRLLAADAARHPADPPIPLYDFGGYSSVTTEPLPAKGSRQEMRYYWDSSHFKEVVGDWVLDKVLDTRRAGSPLPADFGVKLTPENIEGEIARARAARVLYRLGHDDEIEAIHTWVDRFIEDNGIDREDVVRARV